MLNISVLNTRPAQQAPSLTFPLQELGAKVTELPTLIINPLYFSKPDVTHHKIIIFLSANAVNNFFSQVNPNEIANLTVIGIGPSTKQTLINHGITNVIIPDEFSSHGILELKQLSDKPTILVTGKDPNPLLINTLKNKNISLTHIICYERICAKYNMNEIINKLNKAEIDTVISTSYNSLTCLLGLFSSESLKSWLVSKKLYVVTNEMYLTAINYGFSQVVRAENATTTAIISSITRP